MIDVRQAAPRGRGERDELRAWACGLACVLLVACGGDPGESGGPMSGVTWPPPATGAGTTSGDPSGDPTADPTEGPGSDTEDAPTGGPPPGCEGVELQQDGVLDLDIPAVDYVVVSGAIRVNGDTAPDAAGPRGQIVFDYTAQHGRPGAATYTLAATGPETYSLVVPAGVASVRFVPDPGLCAAEPDGPMPCTGGTLLAGVALSESGVLDLDIPTVSVSGAVTQNGAVMPDEAVDRGHLEFVGPAGDAAAARALGPAGAATYAVTLFPGAHDVFFAGNPAQCGVDGAAVPCNRGALERGLVLESSGVLDLDVPAVQISGAVTVNGAAAPDGAVDRGGLRMRPTGDVDGVGAALTASFGASGPIHYSLGLVAGIYDVELVANPALCSGAAPPLPCAGGRLLASVELTQSGVLDVDVPLIEVGGAVTLRGAALPDEAGDRGALVFTREHGEAATVGLGGSGPADYVLGLLPGRHELAFAANPALCDGVDAPQVPCTGGVLRSIDLAASGVLDVDLDAVEIAGNVTLDGAALPDQAGDRGAIVFTGGSSLTIPLAAAGPIHYAVTLFPGDHDIAHAAAEGACDPANPMPCGGGRLIAGISLVESGVLDLDIPSIALTGAVTLAGEPLPDLGQPRGALRWLRADDAGGGVALDLGAAGAAHYELTVIPGRWVVEHAANLDLCADQPSAVPCTDQVLLGCPDL